MLTELPSFYNMQITDKGDLSSSQFLLYLDQTYQLLNKIVGLLNLYVTSDYIAAVSKTTAEITALEPYAPLGAIWFNTTLAKLVVKTASGTIETIQSI